MRRGVRPSVCLTDCRVPRPNSRTERPMKPNIGRMKAHHTNIPWHYLEVKRSKVTRSINAVTESVSSLGARWIYNQSQIVCWDSWRGSYILIDFWFGCRPKCRDISRCCRCWRKVMRYSSGKRWQRKTEFEYFVCEKGSRSVCEWSGWHEGWQGWCGLRWSRLLMVRQIVKLHVDVWLRRYISRSWSIRAQRLKRRTRRYRWCVTSADPSAWYLAVRCLLSVSSATSWSRSPWPGSEFAHPLASSELSSSGREHKLCTEMADCRTTYKRRKMASTVQTSQCRRYQWFT